MNAGEISGNHARGYGGGVQVNKGSYGPCTFTMNGGRIFGNSSDVNGGGVAVLNTVDSSFIMHGGEIFNNSVGTNSFGGGVYVGDNGSFKKQPAEGSATSGVIYGYDSEEPKSNKVGDGSPTDKGHAVYKNATQKWETTVGETQSLDSTQTGSAGGWPE
jgi:hypothetical protein